MNKYAIVTGAAGLLGYYHCVALCEIGFNLILLDKSKKNLVKTKNKLSTEFENKNILYFVCDITKEKDIKEINKNLVKKNINYTILINNADLNPTMKNSNKTEGSLENLNLDLLKKGINVGLFGTIICSKIFGTQMSKNKEGVIINVSSDLGIIAPDQRIYSKKDNYNDIKSYKPIYYSINKHAIIGITKYLASYWGNNNLRCNSIVPGSVSNDQPKHLIKNLSKRIPLGRLAKPNEYKEAIKFLCSKNNTYMTGQTIILDGGRTII